MKVPIVTVLHVYAHFVTMTCSCFGAGGGGAGVLVCNITITFFHTPAPKKKGVYCFTRVCLFARPSVFKCVFRHMSTKGYNKNSQQKSMRSLKRKLQKKDKEETVETKEEFAKRKRLDPI